MSTSAAVQIAKPEPKKIIVQVAEPLLEKADAVAAAWGITRSDLVRLAMEEIIQRFERERLEQELMEAYIEKEQVYRKTYQEFLEPLTIETFNRTGP